MSKIVLPDSTVIESELTGKTLLVYLYMLKSRGGAVGVREVQRKLGFSSPSVAIYHLDKLSTLGLVEKTDLGEYYIKRDVKVGVLKFYTRLGNLLLPRYLFYTTLFIAMLAYYLILYQSAWTTNKVIAVLFGALASVIFLYETVKIWREKPF